MMGAFREIALELGTRGVPVLPTRQDMPCTPMVANAERLTVQAIAKMLQKPRFANANAAVSCGPRSGISVVDIDSPDPVQLDAALHLFGDTLLIGQTPSGGHHLYYRHAGEGRRIRPFGDDVPLDILGNGLAVLPPSQRPPSKDKCGGAYKLIQGAWSDLNRLPVMADPIARQNAPSPSVNCPEAVQVGSRNRDLFDFLRTIGLKVPDFVPLLAEARKFNAELPEPLDDSEVIKTAKSVWGYRGQGRLYASGGSAMAGVHLDEMTALNGHGDAYLLLGTLRAVHGWNPERPFPLANATAERFNWTKPRYRSARDTLTALGFIECLHPGGRGANDPPIYRLAIRGTISHPNINNTSPPCAERVPPNQSTFEKKGGGRTSEAENWRFRDQIDRPEEILADGGLRKGAT